MVERAAGGSRISPATDRSLVERARNGDLDAFEEIVRARMDAVYRLTFAILGNEADATDAAQETFVAAWQQISRLRDIDRFDAWLQRIAINAARMVHRARRRRGVREVAAADAARTVDREHGSDVDRDARILDGGLRRLDVEQRSILVLHHLEGRPLTEIADLLSIPVGTAKSRLHAARRALQVANADESADR
jgi:RNA polymerase sigma-70 factor (ECF subfamily)